MKDSLGHGSNGRGGSSVVVRNGSSARGIMPSRPFREGQGPVTSNAEAANALASALKSTQAPIHSGMTDEQISKTLSDNYRAQHGWDGDVGKHNGG